MDRRRLPAAVAAAGVLTVVRGVLSAPDAESGSVFADESVPDLPTGSDGSGSTRWHHDDPDADVRLGPELESDFTCGSQLSVSLRNDNAVERTVSETRLHELGGGEWDEILPHSRGRCRRRYSGTGRDADVDGRRRRGRNRRRHLDRRAGAVRRRRDHERRPPTHGSAVRTGRHAADTLPRAGNERSDRHAGRRVRSGAGRRGSPRVARDDTRRSSVLEIDFEGNLGIDHARVWYEPEVFCPE